MRVTRTPSTADTVERKISSLGCTCWPVRRRRLRNGYSGYLCYPIHTRIISFFTIEIPSADHPVGKDVGKNFPDLLQVQNIFSKVWSSVMEPLESYAIGREGIYWWSWFENSWTVGRHFNRVMQPKKEWWLKHPEKRKKKVWKKKRKNIIKCVYKRWKTHQNHSHQHGATSIRRVHKRIGKLRDEFIAVVAVAERGKALAPALTGSNFQQKSV